MARDGTGLATGWGLGRWRATAGLRLHGALAGVQDSPSLRPGRPIIEASASDPSSGGSPGPRTGGRVVIGRRPAAMRSWPLGDGVGPCKHQRPATPRPSAGILNGSECGQGLVGFLGAQQQRGCLADGGRLPTGLSTRSVDKSIRRRKRQGHLLWGTLGGCGSRAGRPAGTRGRSQDGGGPARRSGRRGPCGGQDGRARAVTGAGEWGPRLAGRHGGGVERGRRPARGLPAPGAPCKRRDGRGGRHGRCSAGSSPEPGGQ